MPHSSPHNQSMEELALRLAEAECRIAYQEDSLHTLSDQLAHQQQRIMQLEASLALLYRQQKDLLASANDAAVDAPANEKPPHY